ncbi:MAG: murein DD-endopeptidase MepM/ murein hydrolase activator NlpD [Cyclobacteriaceae bacterium]
MGDIVKKGDVIGYVGSSGKSTAPHLHYEVYKDDKVVNPASYIKDYNPE